MDGTRVFFLPNNCNNMLETKRLYATDCILVSMSSCFSLNEVVPMAKIGMNHYNIDQTDRSLLDPKLWIKEFTWTRDGFCFTLNNTDMHQIIHPWPWLLCHQWQSNGIAQDQDKGDGKHHLPISEDCLGAAQSCQPPEGSLWAEKRLQFLRMRQKLVHSEGEMSTALAWSTLICRHW